MIEVADMEEKTVQQNEPILSLDHVSIRYMKGDFKEIGMKEFIVRKLTKNYKVTEFWADKDVHFSINRGDMLGIIGTNGAGKSTLLKAISGIMVPTKGSVSCNGKIAALLELGSRSFNLRSWRSFRIPLSSIFPRV